VTAGTQLGFGLAREHPEQFPLIGQASTFLAGGLPNLILGGTRRELPLPCQRMGDDGFQIVKMRLPSERGADTVGSRHDVSGVTRPSARELDLEVNGGHTLDDLDHFEHEKPRP
jgi:hypothetical protein